MAVEITDELQALRAEAERLGIVADGRWGETRLRDEIAGTLAEGVDPESDDELSDDEAIAAPDDRDDNGGALRAGGHIDRGDGRGWMVEE